MCRLQLQSRLSGPFAVALLLLLALAACSPCDAATTGSKKHPPPSHARRSPPPRAAPAPAASSVLDVFHRRTDAFLMQTFVQVPYCAGGVICAEIAVVCAPAAPDSRFEGNASRCRPQGCLAYLRHLPPYFVTHSTPPCLLQTSGLTSTLQLVQSSGVPMTMFCPTGERPLPRPLPPSSATKGGHIPHHPSLSRPGSISE